MKFTSEGWHTVAGRGEVAFVRNPEETHDFQYLKGKEVEIDGKLYRVKAVEYFCHSPPWRKGEPIGLLVKDIEADLAKIERLVIPSTVRRLAIFGDVHGCFDELMKLVTAIGWSEATADQFMLLFTGDLVDRGPKIDETLNFVMRFGKTVLGNHDRKLAKWYRNPTDLEDKPELKETVRQIRAANPYQLDAYVKWIETLPHVIDLGSLGWVVHAGIDPSRPMTHQLAQTCLYTRRNAQGEPWYMDYDPHGKPIFFGHEVHRVPTVYHPSTEGVVDRPHLPVYPLDGGCAYGGYLTAVVFSRDKDRPFSMLDRGWVGTKAIKTYCEPDPKWGTILA